MVNLLEKPGIWQSIVEVKHCAVDDLLEGNIHDIVDGKGYKICVNLGISFTTRHTSVQL